MQKKPAKSKYSLAADLHGILGSMFRVSLTTLIIIQIIIFY